MARRALRLLRFVARTLLVVVLTVLIGTPLAAGTAVAAYVMLPLPAEPPAMRPLPVVKRSLVYAADGTLIGEFREADSRRPVPPTRFPTR